MSPYIDTSSVPIRADFFASSPICGVTFGDNNSERAQNLALTYGLTKEVVGRRTFYQGKLTQEQAVALMHQGAEADTYLPYGICSLGGLLAFYTIRRILFIMLFAFPESQAPANLAKFINLDVDDETQILSGITISSHGSTISPIQSCSGFSLDVHGHFCPWFEGLGLPDKNFLPSVFQSMQLSRLLANSYTGVSNALSALKRGWRSLCYTQQGMELSHLIQAMEIAFSMNARPIMLQSSHGRYAGTVIISRSDILKGSLPIESETAAQLQENIRGYDSHDRGLSEIAQILNNLKDDDDPEITPQHLSSPRRINRQFRRFSIDQECRKRLQEALARLDFPQKFYEVKDKGRLSVLVDQILNDTEPSIDAPLPYKSDVIFTSNLTLLALGAYGTTAPTFSLVTADRTIPLQKSQKGKDGKLVNNSLKDANISHLPVFDLPLQQAAAAWDNLKKNAIIKINVAAGKPSGARLQIPRATQEGQAFQIQLGRFVKSAANPNPKRKRDANEEEATAVQDAKRLLKRLKLQGADAEQFMALAGLSAADLNLGDDEDMDV